jgi:hypothetical protein
MVLRTRLEKTGSPAENKAVTDAIFIRSRGPKAPEMTATDETSPGPRLVFNEIASLLRRRQR